MPGQVKNAREATDLALSFIKKYRFIALPLKAMKDDGSWLVEIDVGPITTKVAQIKIDAKSGEILEYSIPQ